MSNRRKNIDKLRYILIFSMSMLAVTAIAISDEVNDSNLSSTITEFKIASNSRVPDDMVLSQAEVSLQDLYGIAPTQVLSPVIGNLEQIGPTESCSGTKWCFNQHQSGGHLTPGICSADDKYAWDANLNTPSFDSDNGKPVYAVASGTVSQTYGGCLNTDGTYGQVLIEHSYQGSTWWSGYLHLDPILVKRGQTVTVNTIIGYISDKGATNNHLHFVVYTGKNSNSNLKSFDALITPRSGAITAPTVTNNNGATLVTTNSARLNGEITNTGGENPTVRIYFGPNDGGTNPGSWANYVEGIVGLGLFWTDVTGLNSGTSYYYRCYASNSAGSRWASSTAKFTTTGSGIYPPTVTNDGGASGISHTVATLGAQITDTGGSNPELHICWGTSNGGTNPSSWQHNANLGTKGKGTYYYDASPLTPGTTYYYRSYAKNSAGTGWASSTVSFSTPQSPVSSPVVTNDGGASGIGHAVATLGAQITDTGGSNPELHICWGTSNGGTNPSSWQHNANLGTKGKGTYYYDASPLTPGTTYYYRSYAKNSAGTGWASSTVAFTTTMLGNGVDKLGNYKGNGIWAMDYNGNGKWDGTSIDRLYAFGSSTDQPVVGDWNGDGKDELGNYKGNGVWALDYNGNGAWDGTSTDRVYSFGTSTDQPVVGGW